MTLGKGMVEGQSLGLTETSMREISRKGKNMVKGQSLGLMEESMLVNLKMGKSMKENGRMD